MDFWPQSANFRNTFAFQRFFKILFLSQYQVPKNSRDFAVKLCNDQSKRFQIMKFDWGEIALTDWEDK